MKRFLSIVLSVILTLSNLSMTNKMILANEQSGSESMTETKQVTEARATNVLGEIVADAIDETNTEREENSGCGIFDVSLSETTATVHFSAPDNTTLVVSVYEEESMKMLSSGKAAVDSDMAEAAVKLSDFEFPEHYIIKAFLLDADHAPVCENYENKDHTVEMEQFYEKSADLKMIMKMEFMNFRMQMRQSHPCRQGISCILNMETRQMNTFLRKSAPLKHLMIL